MSTGASIVGHFDCKKCLVFLTPSLSPSLSLSAVTFCGVTVGVLEVSNGC